MKKVLVFALVLSLVLGSFSFAFAADFSDTEDTDFGEAVNVLNELGVVDGYPDGTYKPEGIVTRAEMAKLLIVALGLEDYVSGAYAAFPDVAGSHWATSFIAYAASMGIIEGYPDGQFKPDKTVTYQEAATMIVRALGYQDQFLTGVWPASHVSMAMNLGILDGIMATADGANRGDIAIMLYQSLTCATVTYDSSGNIVDGKNMLSRLGASAINADENGVPMPIVITKDLADDAVININEYIGAFASVYVNKDDEVIIVADVESVFLEGEVNFDKGEFTLDDDTVYTFKNRADANDDWPMYEQKQWIDTTYITGTNRVAEAGHYGTVDYEAVDFYNGAQDANMTFTTGGAVGVVRGEWDELQNDDNDYFTIAAKVSGNYITDVYSVNWWAPTAEVEWDADLAEELAEDDTVDDWKFVYDDADEINLDSFILLGADSLDAIAADNVVTVYVDDNPKAPAVASSPVITKIEVGTETVTGKITKVSSGGAYTIDGTAYDASALYEGTALGLGREGTFSLNYAGEIAFFEADDYAGNYALQLNKAQNDKSTITNQDAYKVYLLDKAGEKDIYDFKDNAANGVGYKWEAHADNVPGALVEIETNADGKITEIRKPASLVGASGQLSDKGVLGGKLITEDVVVFLAYEDVEDWSVGTLKDVAVDTELSGNVRYATNSDGKIDAIVVDKAAGAASATEFGFFTSWLEDYDADDTKVFSGSVLVEGAAIDYMTADQTVTNVKNKDTLYVLNYSGDAVKSLVAAAAVTKAAIQTTIPDDSYVLFESGLTTKPAIEMIANSLNQFYQVLAKDGDRLDLGTAAIAEDTAKGTPAVAAVPDYQLVEGAAIYKVTLKSSDDFDKLAVGDLSEIKKDCYVMLLQLDKDSDNWDTVIYVTKADAAKLAANDTYKNWN